MDEGFDVDSAGDVKRGIELAKHHRPDAALVDLMMAGDGMTVCDQLRTLYSGRVPVLLMSADNGAHSVALRFGYHYIAKPFDLDHVLEVVRSVTLAA